MNKYLAKNKKIFSFDKSFSTNIIFSQPDKYKLLEKISNTSDNLINIGSNLSYSPLGFSKESLSINIKNFDRQVIFSESLDLCRAGYIPGNSKLIISQPSHTS